MPNGEADAELRELGSRFLAVVAPASDAGAARDLVERLRREHPDATHHCFAWRIGWPPAERSSDAGEPGGTAGAPILQALRTTDLSDVVAVVVRWFGGTKLGKGGLVRAYGGVTRAALARLPTRLERPRRRLLVVYPFERTGAVRRLLRAGEIELVEERFGAAVQAVLAVVEERREGLLDDLAALGLEARDEDAEISGPVVAPNDRL
ncbi:MAG TPA: YigZ family protein [Thermoanaerobaculia bacterium]|nr:YigZ family protein [Thermoanaerobaculia bacterium]